MNTTMIVLAVAAAGLTAAAQPVQGETINLICKYQPVGGYSDMEVIWADTATMTVHTVLSLQNRPAMHGLNGGGNIDDALLRAGMIGQIKTWPATITPATITWTSQDDTPRPVQIDRKTGILTWTTPQDPTPPNQGTAHCDIANRRIPDTQVAPFGKHQRN